MAREDQLAWLTLADVTAAASAFLDPVLAGETDAIWNPKTWTWERPHGHVALPVADGHYTPFVSQCAIVGR